jgi:hypothetical protein
MNEYPHKHQPDEYRCDHLVEDQAQGDLSRNENDDEVDLDPLPTLESCPAAGFAHDFNLPRPGETPDATDR